MVIKVSPVNGVTLAFIWPCLCNRKGWVQRGVEWVLCVIDCVEWFATDGCGEEVKRGDGQEVWFFFFNAVRVIFMEAVDVMTKPIPRLQKNSILFYHIHLFLSKYVMKLPVHIK